jgi:hypothetical protein
MNGAVSASAKVTLLLPPKNGAASLSKGSTSLPTMSTKVCASLSFSSPSALRIWNQKLPALENQVSTKKLMRASGGEDVRRVGVCEESCDDPRFCNDFAVEVDGGDEAALW